MDRYLSGAADEGHVCVVDEESGRLFAVAYYEPIVATDRAWELVMIGLRRATTTGRAAGASCSGTSRTTSAPASSGCYSWRPRAAPRSAPPARFYRSCGYDEEAPVRDYFADGEDMVLFHKAL